MPKTALQPFPPEIVGEGELEQSREDECGAGSHPDIYGLKPWTYSRLDWMITTNNGAGDDTFLYSTF